MSSFDCQFCEEFSKGFLEVNGNNLGSRIIFETENFKVFPTIGQITEGYLLISSKRHYLSFGEIPSEQYAELESVKENVKAVLAKNYISPIFFEHGAVSSTKKGGCCIDHAHIHAVPITVDLLKHISQDFKGIKIDSFNDLKKQFERKISYLFYEDPLGSKYLFEIPDIFPPQYIRQIIAREIGLLESWDWRTNLGFDKLLNTIDRLKDKF